MDKYVFAVFEGDAWLSTSSLVLMGVFEDFGAAVENIIDEMSDNQMFDKDHTRKYTRSQLEEGRQTPTCFDTRYIIETVELNKWGEV